MFWIWARIVPNAGFRVWRSEETRASFSSIATLVPVSTCMLSSPFGPFTCTRPSVTRTSTPEGIATGSLPILDMAASLPDVGDELAPETRFAGLAVGHHPARGGHDRGPQAAQHPRQPGLSHVHATPRRAHAADAADDVPVVGAVLEVDPEHSLARILDQLEVADVALTQQHLRDLRLHLRSGNVDLAQLGANRVPHAREEVRDRIRNRHALPPEASVRSVRSAAWPPWCLPARFDDAGNLARQRQLPEADAAQSEVAQIGTR